MLGVLQENLLVLLAFDDERSKVIRHTIPPEMFGGQYKLIAARIYDYIDKYKKSPNDHLADILEDKITSSNKREADLYSDIIGSIHEAKANINAAYVMAQMGTFGRRQALRSVAVDLAKALQRDTEASLGEAEALIKKAQSSAMNVFDPGVRLGDKKLALNFLDIQQSSFPTGIAELDKRGFGPTRKEFWMMIASTKKGKSWALAHLAKMAVMHRHKVLHITLENSWERTAQRYYQAFFSISKRKEKYNVVKFEKDSLGRISGLADAELKPALSFDDPHIREKLEKRIDKWGPRLLNNIIVKQFPTGSLTVPQLEAYMANLETTERFTPDLLVIDYPDLMKQTKDNLRGSLDETYKDLRGLFVERNIAGAAVSQSNRGAASAKSVKIENVAEAWSKIAHCDTVITYSQTEAEKQIGLARLNVAAGRNDADNLTMVISQNYGTGNFVIDSVPMTGNYFQLLPATEFEEGE